MNCSICRYILQFGKIKLASIPIIIIALNNFGSSSKKSKWNFDWDFEMKYDNEIYNNIFCDNQQCQN